MSSPRALSARLAEMPEPGKTMTPMVGRFEHPVVAFEGRRHGVTRPLWLEGNLCDFAIAGQRIIIDSYKYTR
jgi:hypothetical protein